jgi:PAS domain-containing protein
MFFFSSIAKAMPEKGSPLSANHLELQLATAMQRFNTLQRRVEGEPGSSTGLLSRSLHELEKALEEVRVAHEQLVENRGRLEQVQLELTQQYDKYWQLFDEMPQPYVVTRADTTITEANQATAELLNVSQRFLPGKTLSVFVCEDRTRFLQDVAQIASSHDSAELRLRLRPREKAPLDVSAKVRGGDALRWVLARV